MPLPPLKSFRIAALMLFAAGQTAVGSETYRGHGLAMHGDLKYKAGFSHFNYVNPNAPKGGETVRGAIGGYDTFNPFVIKGRAAAGSGLIYDTLMASSSDEPFSQYGLIAESVETPTDRSWVSFTLRKEARWQDGKPITVEDVIWTFNTLVEKGLRDDYIVLVGGAPLNEEFGQAVGADAYCRDAAEAATTAVRMVQEHRLAQSA